jgi:hypothetical protein
MGLNLRSIAKRVDRIEKDILAAQPRPKLGTFKVIDAESGAVISSKPAFEDTTVAVHFTKPEEAAPWH